ncbi:acyltransferase family protein [Enterococcus larvae]|uniref:acyltransferase family protein n=1 Tax=Enterococcus larvae TaxID=2794352 RepID=UPI003F2C87DC
MENAKKNIQMIDLLKFIAAIMVVCIHSEPISGNEWFNFLVKNILCRIAVPLFFISSAYFIRKSTVNKEGNLKGKIVHLLKNYLFWSVVFLPIGLDWINQNLSISPSLYPAALLFGLVYSGTYYHLWYIPAFILSVVIITKARQYISYKLIFLIAAALYFVGSLETYYGLITIDWVKEIFDGFIQLFFTTRNGLFYGMIFTAIGFFIYDYEQKLLTLKKYFKWALLFLGSLLFLEGVIVYNMLRLDCNFLIVLIPFSFVLFLWGITSEIKLPFNTVKLRALSHYYYFIHPICIVILFEIGNAFNLSFFSKGLTGFLLSYLFTHLLSVFLIKLKEQQVGRGIWLSSFLSGAVFTTVIVGCIYIFETASVPIQFELASCVLISQIIILAVLISKLISLRRKRNIYSLG